MPVHALTCALVRMEAGSMSYYLLPGLVLACLIVLLAARSWLRSRISGLYYVVGVVVATYIPLLVFFGLAMVWIPGQYSGVCYRFGDAVQPCTFTAYLRGEFFDLLLYILIPIGIMAIFLGLMVFVDLLRYGSRLTPIEEPDAVSH